MLSDRKGVGGDTLMFSPGPQPFKNINVGGLLMAALVCCLFLSLFWGLEGIIYFDREYSPAVL